MNATGGTTLAPAPVDLTSGSAHFISGAVLKLSQVADQCRNLPGGMPLPSAIRALARIGVHYNPQAPGFFMQDRAGVRVGFTIDGGAYPLSVTSGWRP